MSEASEQEPAKPDQASPALDSESTGPDQMGILFEGAPAEAGHAGSDQIGLAPDARTEAVQAEPSAGRQAAGSKPEDLPLLRRRELLFLQGSSGSGKSTFIKLCLGILPWNLQINGSLTYYHHFQDDNRKAKKINLIQGGRVSWHQFRHLAGHFFGYCPQDPFARFDANRKLRRQLAESSMFEWWSRAPELAAIRYAGLPSFHMFVLTLNRLFNKGGRDAIDRELVAREYGRQLEDAYLEEHDLDALPGQRSYGFNQRIGMVQLPPSLAILFLDEPFNGVDVVTRRRLVDYYCELLEVGRVQGIVCATHDRKLIERFERVMTDRGLKLPGRLKLDAKSSSSGKRKSVGVAKLPKVEAGPVRERAHVYRHSEGRHLHVIVSEVLNEPRTFLGITGPSNCGKTSLGRYLCGWRKGGRVRDHRIFVPQNPFASFSPGLPVRESFRSLEEIGEVARMTGRAAEIMPLLQRPPSALSGGQLQRLQIFGAIASGPDLLFLDEPFAHQDDEWAKTLEEVLKKVLKHELVGRIILVSHDIRRLLSACQEYLHLGEFYLRAANDDESLVLTVPILRVDLPRKREQRLNFLRSQIAEIVEGEELLDKYYSLGQEAGLSVEEIQRMNSYYPKSFSAKLDTGIQQAGSEQDRTRSYLGVRDFNDPGVIKRVHGYFKNLYAQL